MNVNTRFHPTRQSIGKEGRANPPTLAPISLITHNSHTQMHFPRVRSRTGGNGVKPRLKLFQNPDKLLGIREVRRVIDHQIHQITPPTKFFIRLPIIRLHQGPQEGRATLRLPFLQDRFVQGANVVVMNQGISQGDLAAIRSRHFTWLKWQIRNNLIHHRRRIQRVNSQRISDLIFKPRSNQRQRNLVGLLRARTIEIPILNQKSREGIRLGIPNIRRLRNRLHIPRNPRPTRVQGCKNCRRPLGIRDIWINIDVHPTVNLPRTQTCKTRIKLNATLAIIRVTRVPERKNRIGKLLQARRRLTHQPPMKLSRTVWRLTIPIRRGDDQ